MGNIENITADTFSDLVNVLHISIDEAKIRVYHLLEVQKESKFKKVIHEEPRITEMFTKAAKAWGQSIEEARRSTYDLLQYDLKRFRKET